MQGTANRIPHQQVSTPAMQKSTARLIYKHVTTTTTADPRVSLMKGNVVKQNHRNDQNHQDLKDRSDATAVAVTGKRGVILPLCLILFSTMVR